MAPLITDKLNITEDSRLKIDGDFNGSEWGAINFDDEHYIVAKTSEGRVSSPGFGVCSAETLVSLLSGLVFRNFSGTLDLLIGSQKKSLYFKSGELVFARSNLMDDRLGEVIYRGGKITIEQMTTAAVAVTRERKFGKVLIESRDYNSADLWDFLKLQIKSIFQSVFLSEHVGFKVCEEVGSPPVSIILEETTESLIEQCASFSQMFRGFRSRVGLESKLHIRDASTQGVEEGTHLYDTLRLIRDNPEMSGLLDHSKLSDTNTYLNLFQLVVNRYVEVVGLDASSKPATASVSDHRELKGLIDAYHVALKSSVTAFENSGVAFPFEDLENFAHRLYQERNTPIYLKTDGGISVESVRHLYDKGRGSLSQQQTVAWALQGLIQFVLQITGDLLPKDGWAVKKSIQEMLA